MENSCTSSLLTDAARLVRLLKVGGYCATKSTRENSCKISSRWHVDGYEWELRICTDYFHSSGITPWVALELSLLSGSSSYRTHVRTILGCRLLDPTGVLKPSEEKRKFGLFSISNPESSMSTLKLIKREDLESSGYLQDDAFTLQCTITVLKELPVQTFPAPKEIAVQVPPASNLHQQLGELLQSEAGADVTFVVSGESFAAHKLILAARSPVFIAQFYGQMMKKSSQQVDIKDMEAAVFKALLRFVYTDMVPDFEEQHEDKEAVSTMVMAQHLLAAADRYGIERLKLSARASSQVASTSTPWRRL
jgi:speckle-type POZ protein